MNLKGYRQLNATLHLKSGLHVGSGEKGHYGEPLSVIVSLTSQSPYLPGSSVKGKMRHLLEVTFGKTTAGKPCSCGKCQICLLFGSGESKTTYEPSRLIFRDCYLTPASCKLLEKIDLEKKAGVRIDRDTGKAAEKALYALERVPEGCEFNLEVSSRIFQDDDPDAVRQWLAMGLRLIEQDALGGSGTRGSGYVEFKDISFDGRRFAEEWRANLTEAGDKLINVQIKVSSEEPSN